MNETNSQEAQFVALLEDHRKLIFKIANAYSRDEEDRRDLLQEIALQLWRSFPKYDDAYATSTWIYRIALNVSISHLRRESRRRKNILPANERLIDFAVAAQDEGPEPEDLQLLRRFIAELPPLERALILLYLEEKKQREIGDILGMTASNVSTKLGRIKQKLRAFFQSQTT